MAKPIPGNTSIAEGKTNAEILAENFPILPDTASGKVVTERPKPALAPPSVVPPWVSGCAKT